MLVEHDSRQNYGEERYIGMGFLRQRVVIVTFLELYDDVIRIISLRKALKHERIKFDKGCFLGMWGLGAVCLLIIWIICANIKFNANLVLKHIL